MNTIQEFQTQQKAAVNILRQLEDFLNRGEEFGVTIDEAFKEKIEQSKKDIGEQKLRVALVGGFSEGKTSIAAAWLGKVKDDMKISHKESSDAVNVYELDNIDLVDTPGLFGFKEKCIEVGNVEKYKDITKKYVSEANLILYVMNPSNPIKESHKEDLEWLFKDLKLLPRTVFVISKFDTEVDPEYESEYNEKFKVKKENIIARLSEILSLSEDEKNTLSIVAVSANPYDEEMTYWLEHQDEFKKLSHIQDLEDSTANKIKENGGLEKIVNETKKSIIKDILSKQLPAVREVNSKTIEKLKELSELKNNIAKEITNLLPDINEAKISLREFIIDYFSGILRKLEGTELDTISSFIDEDIGEKGIIIETKVQNQFERYLQSINSQINTINNDFNVEIDNFTTFLQMTQSANQGAKSLVASKIINNKNILAARDAIVSGAKKLGFDIAKKLKFKPHGAEKLAKNANVALAAASVILELVDSAARYRQEQKFKNAKKEMREAINSIQADLIELLNDGEEFIDKFFPNVANLQKAIAAIEAEEESVKNKQAEFEKWVQEGEIIDAEFEEIN